MPSTTAHIPEWSTGPHPPRTGSGGVGKPRFDKYSKLLSRFYEPLVLLWVMGKTRGPYIDPLPGDDAGQDSRRVFLNDLAYLCDFEKGGPTTTAIAVQDLPDGFVFWVASNNTRNPERASTFVSRTLAALHQIVEIDPGESLARQALIDNLTTRCLQMASSRIRDETKMLQNAIKTCNKFAIADSPDDTSLMLWLDQFRDKSLSADAVCWLAYGQRHAAEMADLAQRARLPGQKAFGDARHFVGRLAAHIRAPKRLVENADSYLHSCGDLFHVRTVAPVDAVPKPEADSLTRSNSILNRMLGSHHDDPQPYLSAMQHMTTNLDLDSRISAKYQHPKFIPAVHCEIQMHEHFWHNKLEFAFGNKIIGCSKRACFCCWLYMRFHPASFEIPGTHQNIYPNWSPPALPPGCGKAGHSHRPKYLAQLKVLNGMVEEIRQVSLRAVLENGQRPVHPDSTTGITGPEVIAQRMAAMQLDHGGSSIPVAGLASEEVAPPSHAGSSSVSLGMLQSSEFSSDSSTVRGSTNALAQLDSVSALSDPEPPSSDDEGGASI